MPAKNLKILTICLLGVCGLAVSLAFLKTTKVVLEPKPSQAMKGAESGVSRILKEESYWQRYGVNPSGLVLWLDQSDPRSFGNASTWYDLSGKGNHGTQTTADYRPAIASGSGLAGYARSFDGGDDYVILGGDDTFKTLTSGTVSGWIKINNLSVERCFFAVGPKTTATVGYLFWIVVPTNGSLEIRQRNNTSDSILATLPAGTITTNTWYQFTWAVDANGNKFYINGIQKTLTYTAGSSGTNYFFDDIGLTQNYWLGKLKYNGSDGSYFNGLIDDVQIFSRALTAAEIKKLYLADKPRHGGM